MLRDVSLEPDLKLPFESAHAASARTEPPPEAPHIPQSRRRPMSSAWSAAAMIFRKLFAYRRAARLPSGDRVSASPGDFSHLLDERAQVWEEFTRFEARCLEIETRNARAAEIENSPRGPEDQSVLKSEQMVAQLE